MRRVIKTKKARTDNVVAYEHNQLELVVPPPSADGSIDPASLLAEVKAKAEADAQAAYEEGIRRGMTAGEERFQETVAGAAEMLQKTSSELSKAHQEFLKSLEPQVVKLALEVAKRILQREAHVTPEVVKSTARAALAQIMDQSRVTLKVNPADIEAIRKHHAALLEDFQSIEQLDILPDERVPQGGCVAETENYHIDACLESQLQTVLDRLLES